MSPQPAEPASKLQQIRARIAANLRPGLDPDAALLAVGKMQPASAIRALAEAGQRRFGENYVQEAVAKRAELADLALEWHLIGPLQSNKCRVAAQHFDWVQSIDREKIVPLLARERGAGQLPLNVLVQVNIDDESSKSGCRPEQVEHLAAAIQAHPTLRLRGLMAIPAPHPDPAARRAAFEQLRAAYERLQRRFERIDTLSMGMSEDFELALACGATLVRVGSALFGARAPASR
jgi:pyridoxal phosphate enzyme (YggS family)